MKMMSLQQISRFCLGAALSTLVLGTARANLIVYDPFDYDAGSPWSSEDGGQGFTSPWEEADSVNPDMIRAGSLSHGNLQTSGNSVLTSAVDQADPSWREISDAAGTAGSTTWVSFLFALETTNGGIQDGDYFSIQLATSTSFLTTATVNIGVFNTGGELNFGIADGNFSPVDLSSIALVPGETYFLTASIEWDGNGSNEVIRLYLNPTLGSGAPDISTAIAVTTALSIDTITSTPVNRLNGIGLAAGDIGTEWAFDELRIGTTYGDVAPVTAVPEPSTVLLVLGGLVAVRVARRKRGPATGAPVRAE